MFSSSRLQPLPIVFLIAFLITGLASDFGATSLVFSHRVDDSCFDGNLTDCPYFRFRTTNLENGNHDTCSVLVASLPERLVLPGHRTRTQSQCIYSPFYDLDADNQLSLFPFPGSHLQLQNHTTLLLRICSTLREFSHPPILPLEQCSSSANVSDLTACFDTLELYMKLACIPNVFPATRVDGTCVGSCTSTFDRVLNRSHVKYNYTRCSLVLNSPSCFIEIINCDYTLHLYFRDTDMSIHNFVSRPIGFETFEYILDTPYFTLSRPRICVCYDDEKYYAMCLSCLSACYGNAWNAEDMFSSYSRPTFIFLDRVSVIISDFHELSSIIFQLTLHILLMVSRYIACFVELASWVCIRLSVGVNTICLIFSRTLGVTYEHFYKSLSLPSYGIDTLFTILRLIPDRRDLMDDVFGLLPHLLSRLLWTRLPRSGHFALQLGVQAFRPTLSSLGNPLLKSTFLADTDFDKASTQPHGNHTNTGNHSHINASNHCTCKSPHSLEPELSYYLLVCSLMLFCLSCCTSSFTLYKIWKLTSEDKNHSCKNHSKFVSSPPFDSSTELFRCSKFDSFISVSSCPWLTQGTVMTVSESHNDKDDQTPTVDTTPLHNEDKAMLETRDQNSLHVTKSTANNITTPDKRISDRVAHFSWESSQENNSDSDTASESSSVSSLGSQLSQSSLSKNSKGAKWITNDGEYDLDRSKTCKLSFIQHHISEEAAANLASDISTAIAKDFSMNNSKRFKMDLNHSCETKQTEAAASDNKNRKKKKISEIQVNLKDDLEICKIVRNFMGRISRAIREIFGENVEFDKTMIHRLDSTSDSVAYENADPNGEGGPFSPAVAILAIGQGLGRPMFLRTKAGSVVTHKVNLRSGSLCVMSGRSEVRYKRAIPKDFGQEGLQFFITMVQKKPDESILNELRNISMSSADESKDPSKLERNLEGSAYCQETKELCKKELKIDIADETGSSPELHTPPTVIRRGSMILENGKPLFKDIHFLEPSGGLLLTETVGAAVDRMDDETVTAELRRSCCPVEGSLEEKRRRLQNKICISLGEMSMSAANMNTSINLLKNASPECDNTTTGLLHGELETLNETFSNSQKCIEDTLKMVVDNIVEMKSEIASVKKVSLNTNNNLVNTSARELIREEDDDEARQTLTGTGKLIRTLANAVNLCSEKVEELAESLVAIKDDLKITSDEISEMKENAVDILRGSVDDMRNYCMSVFADESREQIKQIYDVVIKAYQTLPDNQHESQGGVTGPGQFTDIEEGGDFDDQNELGEKSVEDRVEESVEARVHVRPSPSFKFPCPIVPSLEKRVRSNQRIDVWLITDSIMRHITESDMDFGDKHRIAFKRLDRTSTKALSHQKLLELVESEKPSIIYVHLGINDIQEGSDPLVAARNIEEFDKKVKEVSPGTHIIVSSPLHNGNSYHSRSISSLRRSLMLYLHKQEVYSDFKQTRLTIQPNAHFFSDPYNGATKQNQRYFLDNDRLHLSSTGKRAMISTMRDSLHRVLKKSGEQH